MKSDHLLCDCLCRAQWGLHRVRGAVVSQWGAHICRWMDSLARCGVDNVNPNRKDSSVWKIKPARWLCVSHIFVSAASSVSVLVFFFVLHKQLGTWAEISATTVYSYLKADDILCVCVCVFESECMYQCTYSPLINPVPTFSSPLIIELQNKSPPPPSSEDQIH